MKRYRSSLAMTIAASGLLACAVPARAQDDMGFDVNVTLSKKAAAKLAAERRGSLSSLPITATQSGAPKSTPTKSAKSISRRRTKRWRFRGAGGHARISGATVDTKRLDWLSGPAKVNVNVASARKSSSDNLLNCDFIDGPLADVRKSPVTLHCYLIEEAHPDTQQKP